MRLLWYTQFLWFRPLMIIEVLFYFSPTKENMNEEFLSSAVTNDMVFYMFLPKNSLLHKIRSSNSQNYNRWGKK